MERGRATEGIANLKAASDWLNTKYVLNGNIYCEGTCTPLEEQKLGLILLNGSYVFSETNTTRSVYFTPPIIATCDYSRPQRQCISTSRKQGNETYYTLTAYNYNGELTSIRCSGPERSLCEPLGMEKLSGNGDYEMTF